MASDGQLHALVALYQAADRAQWHDTGEWQALEVMEVKMSEKERGAGNKSRNAPTVDRGTRRV